MAQWVEVLAVKSDNLSLVLGTHKIAREDGFPHAFL